MQRRSFLALPAVAAVPIPQRRVFDTRLEADRRAYIEYLNSHRKTREEHKRAVTAYLAEGNAWTPALEEPTYGPDFLEGIWDEYEGEPTLLQAYEADFLVPRGFADQVERYRYNLRTYGAHTVTIG